MIDAFDSQPDSAVATVAPRQSGFTLSELIVVVGIVGVLNAIAIHIYSDYIIRAKLSESLSLVTPTKVAVNSYYSYFGRWPDSYEDLNLVGNALGDYAGAYSRPEVFEKGAVSVLFYSGGNAESPDGVISFRPAVVRPGKYGSFLWVCGYATPGQRFEVIGHNRTDLQPQHLPGSCR